jgi:hypothetical protein
MFSLYIVGLYVCVCCHIRHIAVVVCPEATTAAAVSSKYIYIFDFEAR